MDVTIDVASWVGMDKAPGLMRNIRIHDNVFDDETLYVNL